MINYIFNQFVLQECGDFTWRVSDCEELVGVTHRRGWWYLGHKSSASTVVMLTSEQYNTLII